MVERVAKANQNYIKYILIIDHQCCHALVFSPRKKTNDWMDELELIFLHNIEEGIPLSNPNIG